jgi:hypothetical protein
MKNVRCKYCKSQPRVVRIDDCYYAQCSKCTKHGKYNFLGYSERKALENWNEANIDRPSNQGEKL